MKEDVSSVQYGQEVNRKKAQTHGSMLMTTERVVRGRKIRKSDRW